MPVKRYLAHKDINSKLNNGIIGSNPIAGTRFMNNKILEDSGVTIYIDKENKSINIYFVPNPPPY